MREKEIEKLKEYKYGFSTDIESIRAPKGLNELNDILHSKSHKRSYKMHDVGKRRCYCDRHTERSRRCFGRSNNTSGYNWADGNEIFCKG